MKDKDGNIELFPLYKAAGFYLLRAPLLPVDEFLQLTTLQEAPLDLKGDLSSILPQICQESYTYLQRFFTQPLVQEALVVATTSLFEAEGRLQEQRNPRRLQRAYSRLLRYLVRMSTRPTPFGLFAGVATGTFTEHSSLQLATPSIARVRIRPDMSWLLSLIEAVERLEPLLPHLHVVVNQAAYVAGGRVIIPYLDIYGQRDQRSASLRATPVVQAVLNYAQRPVSYAHLQAQLLQLFPQANQEQISDLLQQLWKHHLLVSDLRPPLTNVDPGRYIVERLEALSEAQPFKEILEGVLEKTTQITMPGNGDLIPLLQEMLAQQEQVVKQERLPFQIDSALRLVSSHLNRNIGRAAAQAAETLLRLSPFPQGYPHLHIYYQEFVARYGLETEVPLLELLYNDPEPHLRVRFHALEEKAQHPLLLAALAWSHELMQQQLIRKVCVDTYEREIERYGGPDIINAIEDVFAADSTVVSDLLAAQESGAITLDSLEIATFSLYHFFAQWGLSTSMQLQWLLAHVASDAKDKDFTGTTRKKLCELLSPWGVLEDQFQVQREFLLEICSPYTTTVRKVGQMVHAYAYKQALWTPEKSILASLAHMHLNRLLGTNRNEENKAMLSWKMALEGLNRRPEGKREALNLNRWVRKEE